MASDLTEKGLTLAKGFIDEREELALLKQIGGGGEKKNTRQRNSIRRYGSVLPYRGNMMSAQIPEHFHFLLDRLVEKGFLDVRPDSVTVNEYMAGQTITPHIDSKSSGEVVSVLSLLSDAVMLFTNGREAVEVPLPPRSLVQMRGEVRHVWQHSIRPVARTRYSVVFRLGT